MNPTNQTELPFTLTLKLGPGQELSLVHWAFLNLREKFVEEAADCLAQQDALEYISKMESIERIDLLLDEMFFQLSTAYERLFYSEPGDLTHYKEVYVVK